MKCLNESIARQANSEDNVKGHFWEARFKSQALLNEQSLLTCMIYVDLNPIRAKMSVTPEKSDFTSVQERILKKFCLKSAVKEQVNDDLQEFTLPLKPLAKFLQLGNEGDLPTTFPEYLELVDWTGRIIREDKRGYIPSDLPPILTRIKIPISKYLANIKHFKPPKKSKQAA